MATDGTNIVALQKPGVGTTAGPQWASDINNSIDAVDGHDHSTNKGIRITPAAINVNATLEFNQNSASELKNVIFDSSVTASTTNYSVYQASGNLYWRNGSGTAVQITVGGTVNVAAGGISGMTGTDAAVSYADGSKSFNFFTDSANQDYGKMAHADLFLFKFTDDNTGDNDYVTIKANAAVSGSSGTIFVPSEDGTFLTTATSYAGAINVATSSGNSNIALNPHGPGKVLVGNAGASGKLTSNGAHDLVLDTNSGTNAGNITLTDGTNGAITITPHGSGAFTIGGAWTAASQTCANLGTVTTADINGGTIDATTVGAASHTTGKFTTCDATTDFTIGGLVVTDNTITDDGALSIVAATSITLDADTSLAAGHDLETSSSGSIIQRSKFMHNSSHQAWVLGG
jgi:hypothetical protein